MMKNLGILGFVAYIIVLIGGINWGLVGLGDFNVIGMFFGGGMTLLSRLIYILVGISAGYLIYLAFTKKD